MWTKVAHYVHYFSKKWGSSNNWYFSYKLPKFKIQATCTCTILVQMIHKRKKYQLENCRKNYPAKIATLLVVTFPPAIFTKAINTYGKIDLKLCFCGYMSKTVAHRIYYCINDNKMGKKFIIFIVILPLGLPTGSRIIWVISSFDGAGMTGQHVARWTQNYPNPSLSRRCYWRPWGRVAGFTGPVFVGYTFFSKTIYSEFVTCKI